MTLDSLTVTAALQASAQRLPGAAVHFPGSLDGRSLALADLRPASLARAASLRAQGAGPGQVVGLLAAPSPRFLIDFFGVLHAGAAASVLPVPMLLGDQEAFARRIAVIADSCGMRLLVCDPAYADLAHAVAGLRSGIRIAREGGADSPPGPLPSIDPDDLAVVQFTSGSTGRPRGVQLPHRVVMAGLRAIADSAALSPSDVLVQWVPPYHDMGLFGLLAQVLSGGRAHLFSPMSFIRRPVELLRCFAQERATLFTGPNFAYELLVRAMSRSSAPELDLSSWRLAFNGSEPVSADTVAAFQSTFAAFGVRPEVMFPVYGMAEATLAISFPVPGTQPRFVRASRDALAAGILAEPLGAAAAKAVVSCGRPVAGMEVRVVDSDGGALDDGLMGEIQIRGASVTPGYLGDPQATRDLFDGAWMRTGDLGFWHDAALHVAGRAKEMAIVHGQNLFPDDVERAARDVPGVYRGRCVCFPEAGGEGDGSERLGLVVESSIVPDQRRGLAVEVRRHIKRELGVSAVRVYVVQPRWLTKTTSGKWQRLLARERLAAELDGNGSSGTPWEGAEA